MLNVLMSHWMMYVYAIFVVALIVLCIANPARIRTRAFNWRPRRVLSRRSKGATAMRFRQLP